MTVATVAPGAGGYAAAEGGDVELQYAEFPLSDELRRRALILQILEDARRQGQRRRLAVSGPPVLVALASVAVAVLLFAYADGDAPELLASAFLLVVGPVVLLFAILPTDARLIALATALLCLVNLAAVADAASDQIVEAVWHFGRPACGARYVIARDFACATLESAGLLAVAIAAGRTLLVAVGWRDAARAHAPPRERAPQPEETLQRLWDLNGARLLVLAASHAAAYAVAPARLRVRPADISSLVAYVVVSLALAAVCARPSLRASAHRWLIVRGESVSAAAGISMLFDSRFKHVDTAIASAVASLRGVRADRITPAALSGQMSQNAAYLLSQPAHVCGIDAFVCHSSRDPPALKWAALQSWRAQFVAARGREPLIWLDRCCLDHSLRGVGLANLPVTIASCQSMVVLFGTTALSRLWCVVELFVHHHMGGTRLELVHLPGAHAPAIASFDAWHAECHLPEDRVWLLSCIETAAGDRAEFNARMRALLANAHKIDEPLPSHYDHVLHTVGAVPPSIHGGGGSGGGGGGALAPRHAQQPPPPPTPPPPPPPPPLRPSPRAQPPALAPAPIFKPSTHTRAQVGAQRSPATLRGGKFEPAMLRAGVGFAGTRVGRAGGDGLDGVDSRARAAVHASRPAHGVCSVPPIAVSATASSGAASSGGITVTSLASSLRSSGVFGIAGSHNSSRAHAGVRVALLLSLIHI